MAREIKQETIQKIIDKINLDMSFKIEKDIHIYTYRGDCSNGQFKFVISSKNFPECCSYLNIGDFLKNKVSYSFHENHIEIDLSKD